MCLYRKYFLLFYYFIYFNLSSIKILYKSFNFGLFIKYYYDIKDF